MNETQAVDELERCLELLRTRPTVSPQAAAVLMDVSLPTMYASLKAGAMPSVRIGSRWCIPSARLREMLGIEG
ncbi:excisionase family DNA-binding protein [Rhodococcus erythropolis]|jgi:excisionase family DNA binding protein|uniref:excisionase family DNA-binding protein n=1 Tax=Rhodococcus erythropolis TaxID=1833 RepID=UPI00406BD4A6